MGQLENPQWERFCHEYLVDFNGTKAAERAGYAKGKSAEVQSSRLLRIAKVSDRLKELNAVAMKGTQPTAAFVLRELYRVAASDIQEIFKDDGSLKRVQDIPEEVRRSIAAIETVEYFEGQGRDATQVGWVRKIKLWDKNKGLELLGKHFKLYTDKVEHGLTKNLEDILGESLGYGDPK